jgi:hypothetical protein
MTFTQRNYDHLGTVIQCNYDHLKTFRRRNYNHLYIVIQLQKMYNPKSESRKSVSSSVKLAIIWINKCLEFYILLVNSKKLRNTI